MTQQAEIQEPIVANETPRCMHYWVIQPAEGPVSAGVCQYCWETREFKNFVEGAAWGDNRLSPQRGAEEAGIMTKAAIGSADGPDQDDW